MEKRVLWLIPMGISVLCIVFLGVLGFVMWRIGQAPGFSFRMNLNYPFAIIFLSWLVNFFYKKWKQSEGAKIDAVC